jgi:hypothetical protein
VSLENIHENAVKILAANKDILTNGIEVMPEDDGDIEQRIQNSIAKLGLCAIVSMAEFKNESSSSRTMVGPATFSVQVVEYPLINRQKANTCTSGKAARLVAKALHLIALKDGVGDLPVLEGIRGDSVQDDQDRTLIIWTATFKVQTTL